MDQANIPGFGPACRRACLALSGLASVFGSAGVCASAPQRAGDLVAVITPRSHAEFASFPSTRPAPSAKPLPGKPAAPPAPAPRAERPLFTVTSAGPGQAGFVHYFILQLPDESLDIQVGVELDDQRIAWSFPGLGVVVSPFVTEGVISAGGQDYELWHLYGLRPFAEDAAMAALRKALPSRIRPWIEAKTPYCEFEEQRAGCMSCIGFVLRALFPARADGFPDLPRELRLAGTAAKYTPNDLLLYLTGMLALPTREARLRRLARLELPDALREDLDHLVHAMSPGAPPAAAGGIAPRAPAQERALPRPAQRRSGARQGS